jgi:GTPase SAR1 family protein
MANQYQVTMNYHKIVILGDHDNKTEFIYRSLYNIKPEQYIPTIYDNDNIYYKDINNNEFYNISLLDTSGTEKYETFRKLYYNDTNIFIIYFNMNNNNVYNIIEYYNDIKNMSENSIIIIIGYDKSKKYNYTKYNDIKRKINNIIVENNMSIDLIQLYNIPDLNNINLINDLYYELYNINIELLNKNYILE